MPRKLHAFLGLSALALVLVLALSGSVLSVYPLVARLAPVAQGAHRVSVGQLAARVQRGLPGIDSLKRMPSGAIVASSFDAKGMAVKVFVDAKTGRVLHPVAINSAFYETLRSFHRAFLLGNNGRYLTGLGALLLVAVALSGIFLMVGRMGGLSRVFAPARGNWSHRTHTWLARLVLVPLLLTSLSGAYLVAAWFQYLPVSNARSDLYPASVVPADVAGKPAPAPDKLAALNAIALADLRELTFPMAGDRQDVFTAKTNRQLLMIDQYSGAVLERVALTRSERLYDLIYQVHTGKGLAWIGLILGIAALGVPVLAATGSVIWWKRRQSTRRRIRGNIAAAHADIVVLVGSEGGATWGFARSLHQSLAAAGFRVHVAPMNAFTPRYPRARHVLFLCATYGNGHAPASAGRFGAKLADMSDIPNWDYAVLGFGDRAFAQFCEFAKQVDASLADHGCRRLMATRFVNRQSSQTFAAWGKDLSAALGADLALHHRIDLPKTRKLQLRARHIYGAGLPTATAVLRFATAPAPTPGLWDRLSGKDGKRPRFAPSDLLGVLPPASPVPRYYSVASAAADDTVEICVRLQEGGECSTFLHQLAPGDGIDAFVRTNPDFQMPAGRKPVIMVGAGTGIAPFIGMIRANRRHRPIHLFWGGRVPDVDFLYRAELDACRQSRHLASLTTAFSRVERRAYVQDRLREDGERLRVLVRRGASVMVCGGDAMARAVAAEFDAMLAPLGLSVARMKSRATYLEDIF